MSSTTSPSDRERPTSPTEQPEEEKLSLTIKSQGDKKYPVTISPSASVLDLKNLLRSTHPDDIPHEPRLIFSGRVLKNPDTLASYNIKTGNTIHMVKPAASSVRNNAQNSGQSATPVNIAAGTGNDPLAGLTGARYAGHAQLPRADMFGPDGGMGAPPNHEQMAAQLSDPAHIAMLNQMLSDPNMVDQIVRTSPVLRDLPGAREMLQSPGIRSMLTNPDLLRQMGQMSSMFPGGMGGMGGSAAQGGGFPAPGANDVTGAGTTPSPGAAAGQGAAGQQPQNPFASIFGGMPPRQQQGAGAGVGQLPPMPDLATMNQMLQMMGGLPGAGGAEGAAGSAGVNPFAGMFGPLGGVGAPQMPADTRPPEERYAEQLRQLNDMGFYDFERNVEALRRSGGSVQGAVNQLLGN